MGSNTISCLCNRCFCTSLYNWGDFAILFAKTTANLKKSRTFAKNKLNCKMDTSTKGILTPKEIDEEGRYYFVRKAMDAGNVVRLKNGVYATEDGLANTMVDVERIVPGGVLCLYSAWEHYGLTTQVPGSIYVAVEKHRKVVVPEFPPITLCYWEQKYYEMGVVEADVAGHKLRIYDIERSVCDVVRFRNKVGIDVMTEVLRAYLSRKDRNIAKLTDYAGKMRIGTIMAQYLNVMV